MKVAQNGWCNHGHQSTKPTHLTFIISGCKSTTEGRELPLTPRQVSETFWLFGPGVPRAGRTSGSVWRAQFELDVIWVSEDENVDPERRPEIPDLRVDHALAIEDADGVFQVGAARHREA